MQRPSSATAGLGTDSAPRRSAARRALAALAALYVFAIAFPALPLPIQPGLDASWVYGINRAAADGLRYGSEILYTYGPLGYLIWFQDLGANLAWGAAFAVALAALTAGLAGLAVWRAADTAGAALFLLSSATALALGAQMRAVHLGAATEENRILLPVVLALLLATQAAGGRLLVGLAVLLSAATALMKLSLATNCAAALGVYFIAEVARGRCSWASAFAHALLYAATIVALFALTGGAPAELATYLTHALQLAAAYTDGMSMARAPRDVLLAISGLLLFAAAVAAPATRDAALRGPAALLFAVLLLSYKHAFTRQDPEHMLGFWVNFAAFLGMFFLFATGRRERLLGAANMLFAAAVVTSMAPDHISPALLDPTPGLARLRAYASWSDLRAATAAQSTLLLEPLQLPPALQEQLRGGSVDIMPLQTSYAAANRLRWNPRPMFQSFAVLHPAIDDLNARHFDGAGGPDFVLYGFESIDGRHPFFDEPASLRALFCNYAAAERGDGLLVLRRAAAPRCGGWQDLGGERQIEWNTAIALPPAQDGLHVRLDVAYSFWGQLRRAVLRSPEVAILATYADGGSELYRVVPALARNRLWIGALPRDLDGVHRLLTGAALPPLRSIELQTDSPASFRAAVGVTLSQLRTRFAAPPPAPG